MNCFFYFLWSHKGMTRCVHRCKTVLHSTFKSQKTHFERNPLIARNEVP